MSPRRFPIAHAFLALWEYDEPPPYRKSAAVRLKLLRSQLDVCVRHLLLCEYHNLPSILDDKEIPC